MANQNPDNQPLVITTTEPAKFKSIGDCALVTTRELAGLISSIFGNLFQDFDSTMIEVKNDQMGFPMVAVSLLFKILPQNSYTNNTNVAFCPVSFDNGQTNGTVARIKNMTQGGTNSVGIKMNILDRTKKLINGYCIKAGQSQIDYNTYYETYSYEGQVYIMLKNLDIIKLIEVVYGSKDEENIDLVYQVFPLPPIVNYQQDIKDSIIQILNIVRVNAENNERVARWFNMSLNRTPWFNNPNMVRVAK